MCGRAAINHAAPNIVHACRTSGITLPSSTPKPSEYATGKTCKHAKDKDGKLCGTTFPVVLSSGGELTVATMQWGMRQISTHNVWCDDDKWVETKTWSACIGSGRRAAVCVNAFAEGITCRQPSDGLFFLAALYLNGAFVILTTDSTRVPLLAERAASQAEHGVPTRCPLWMDAAEASAAEPYSPTLAQNLAQTLTRSFSPATPHPNPNQANHWLTDDAAATPAGAIAAVPLPRCPDPDLNPEPDHTAYALNIHTARHTHTAYAQHTHCRCAVSRRRCAPISRRSCRAPPLASEERPSSPTHSRAP